jgi:hypothetical protein
MIFTEIFNWLQRVDLVLETIGLLAMICGFLAKWQLGNSKKSGWLWGFAGSFFWLAFCLRIESPTGLVNNIVFLLLAVRGYRIWTKNDLGT